MDHFRPDQWRRLSRRHPSGFDARRRAVLLLELTRIGPPPNARARRALERLERRLPGQDAQARLQTATLALAEAMLDLGRAASDLLRLGTELDRAVTLDLARARARHPLGHAQAGEARSGRAQSGSIQSGPIQSGSTRPASPQAARLAAPLPPSSDSISRRSR
ncbi:MAG: hypothetical protein WCG13_05590 [Burkholderiales bacterium]